MSRPFEVGVADLLGRPGSRRREHLVAGLDGLRVTSGRVPSDGDVVVDLVMEWVSEGILVSGIITAPWEGDCRRCLGNAVGEVRAEVRELFERHPREGESYLLGHDTADLEPLARDALLLELPLAPLCQPGCAGLCVSCGANRNEAACGCSVEAGDPRWDVLNGLRQGSASLGASEADPLGQRD